MWERNKEREKRIKCIDKYIDKKIVIGRYKDRKETEIKTIREKERSEEKKREKKEIHKDRQTQTEKSKGKEILKGRRKEL